MNNNPNAFTLTELSVVLVIMATLITGVSAGKRLVKNANLNKLMQETTKFRTTYQSFYTIYDFVPGDFPNAFTLWGSQNSCTDNDVNSNSTGCNGDGNGIITWSGESYRANQHLALAELITGQYNGTNESIISSYDNYLYTAPLNCAAAGRNSFGTNCHILGDTDGIDDPGLKPSELEQIDFKMDDGVPTTGKIGFMVVTGVVTTTTCGNTSYVSTDALGCNLLYSFD